MQDCIFCKISGKEISARIVYEDDSVFAMLDVHPSAPGHTMVLLKKHGGSMLDYAGPELGTLMTVVQKLARALKEALACESITIGVNHLERRGIKHLHVHLIPRWEDDGGHPLQGVVNNTPKESPDEIAEKIRTCLK